MTSNSASSINNGSYLWIWAGVLSAYFGLFAVTGYISFFQEPYNPGTNLSAETAAALQNDHIREHVLANLKVETDAFKQRKELAAQSFNVVLGALLGFLSATATGAFMNRTNPSDRAGVET